MARPTLSTTYTCAGVSFTRLIDGETFDPWIDPDTQYTKDKVLGGSKVYIDVGGALYPPFAFRGWFSSEADRTTMRTAQGTTVTLANSDGQSGTFTLLKAARVNGLAFILALDLLFEYQP